MKLDTVEDILKESEAIAASRAKTYIPGFIERF